MYLNIKKQIEFVDNKLIINKNAKLGYCIYMDNKSVEFFFDIPDTHFQLFKDKINDTWNNRVTITEVQSIPQFRNDCEKYYMTYQKNDALSLTCDKRNNTLLSSQLNTLNVMEDGDRIMVYYNFFPTEQKPWKVKWDREIENIKNNMPMDHKKISFWYCAKMFLMMIANLTDSILDGLTDQKTTKKETREIELSVSSKQKRGNTVVNAQIVCLSESNSKTREKMNAISLCSAFECLEEDNSLRYKDITKKHIDLRETRIKAADKFIIQPKEGQNFISIPGRELLEEHKVIDHINVLESEIPEKLRSGYISLGVSRYHGSDTEAFLRDTYDQGNFPLVLVGEQGSGKSTYIANYVKYITRRNEGCMLIDYIKNCEVASEIEKAIPKDKIIVLDMSKIDSIQGIGYNELLPKTDNKYDILDVANRKSLYIQMLIDAINVGGDPLTTQMGDYLSAAGNVVFLNPYASIKDVARCLNDFTFRKQCIESIQNNLMPYLEDDIATLRELDDKEKDGTITGTKYSKVDGINHRISLLKRDFRLKTMYNKPPSENIDLVKAMDDGKIVLVKMPQEYFSTPYSINVIVTYLFTKIWSCMLVRGGKEKQPKRFHIIADEIFQAKTAMRLLNEQQILPQTRKFGAKFVFSCQNLLQIETIDQTLRSAGASYMLMKGSGKINYNMMKEELVPYTLEDLESLPQYSCLNIINYEDGRVKFVTKLPKP